MAGPPTTLGVAPRIGAGARGEGLVLHSVAGPDPGSAASFEVWEGTVAMLVTVPGREAAHSAPLLRMTRAKYPIAGTTLPVTVDSTDPSRVRIEWDEVPDIDGWIAVGHPVFTDPDAVRAALTQALDAYEGTLMRGVAEQVVKGLGPASPISPELVPGVLERMRSHVQVEASPTIPMEGASGRVFAASPPGSAEGEVLLSVAVPGSPRYGVRWRGPVPGDKTVEE